MVVNNCQQELIICKECGYSAHNRQSITNHITRGHKMSVKEYYDKWLKKENEDECLNCGKPTKFRNMWYGYNKHCCKSCVFKSTQTKEKIVEYNQKKYGVDHFFQTQEMKDKSKNTRLIKYGDENYNNRDLCRQTCLEKYGVDNVSKSKDILQKIQNSNIDNYGVEWYTQSEQMKEKTKQTKLFLYGDENYNNPDKGKQTKLEKYGDENYNNMDKHKQTCLKRYGVDNASKLRSTKIKCVETARQNGNHSSLEDYLEQALQQHNIEYYIQYNCDNRYPFFCDFYLPDTDCFVEINNYFGHGGHWFNPKNAQDIKKLKEWQLKEHKTMYQNCIRIWTESDVIKRHYAKQNDLNYVVLWTKKDIEEWINSGFIIRKDF